MDTEYHKNENGELILDEDDNPIPSSICLCNAYAPSECLCGAWNDVVEYD